MKKNKLALIQFTASTFYLSFLVTSILGSVGEESTGSALTEWDVMFVAAVMLLTAWSGHVFFSSLKYLWNN